jgi:hypothetical protein
MRRLVFVGLMSCAAAGCSSQSYPASPVPARLSDRDAVFFARNYLAQKNAPPATLVGIQPAEQGTLLEYQTLFQPNATPPREWRLLNVNHTGAVREVTFDSKD